MNRNTPPNQVHSKTLLNMKKVVISKNRTTAFSHANPNVYHRAIEAHNTGQANTAVV